MPDRLNRPSITFSLPFSTRRLSSGIVGKSLFAVLALLLVDGSMTASDAQSRGQQYDRGNRGGGGVGIGVSIDLFRLLQNSTEHSRPVEEPPRRQRVKKRKRTKAKRAARQPRLPAIPQSRRYQLLIAFKPGTSNAQINRVVRRYGLRRLSDARIALIDQRLVKVARPASMTRQRQSQLANDPRVDSIQPNYVYGLSGSVQYAVTKMAIPKAHKVARGHGVLVAVLDSGVDKKHPALAGAVEEEFNALGKVRGIGDPHGTAVASVIAARKGMTGVAPEARVLSVRAFARFTRKERTTAETFHLAKGLDWAMSKGARIINMSFAGPRDALFQRVISEAARRGAVIVAAAGNRGPKAPPAYPAAYPDVIAVTATDAKDRLYRRSNRGDYIAVAAPGVDILTAGRKKGYGLRSGTSIAAAYVSGSIALMMQDAPHLPRSSITDRLALSARDLGPAGKDPSFGHGLVNIYKALSDPEQVRAQAQAQ